VGGEAVELGDQALLGPEAVDLLAVDPSVDVRPGESVGVEKGEDRSSSSRLVMLRPMSRAASSRLMAGVPARAGYRATRSAREVGLPRRWISASVAARSRWWYGTIAARSRSVRGGGDRDAVVSGDLVVREPGQMDLQAPTRAERARNGDLDVHPVRAPDTPQRRGGSVAQDGVGSDERRGHPSATSGEVCHRFVDAMRPAFPLTVEGNVGRVGHPLDGGDTPVPAHHRCVTPSHQIPRVA
jgi:hypothetical protein